VRISRGGNSTNRVHIEMRREVVTKLGSLHSASTWPPFRLCARSVALKFAPAPKPDFRPLNFSSRWPEDWLAPKHPARPNGTPLHSAQLAAPFRQPSFVPPGN
jgi:hypothetical protein